MLHYYLIQVMLRLEEERKISIWKISWASGNSTLQWLTPSPIHAFTDHIILTKDMHNKLFGEKKVIIGKIYNHMICLDIVCGGQFVYQWNVCLKQVEIILFTNFCFDHHWLRFNKWRVYSNLTLEKYITS